MQKKPRLKRKKVLCANCKQYMLRFQFSIGGYNPCEHCGEYNRIKEGDIQSYE